MANDKDLCFDLSKSKEKLLCIDFITTEFQQKEYDNRIKGQGKRRSLK